MKAQYIEAVSQEKAVYPSVFLAGGITACPEWQTELINLLSDELITIFNPRRKNFPIHDPNAAKEQITWEFYALDKADIFSIWFSNASSDQPICMYELGRHVAFRSNNLDTVVIGIEPGYKRSQDVYIQMGLVDSSIPLRISDTLESHAKNIISAVENMVNKNLFA